MHTLKSLSLALLGSLFILSACGSDAETVAPTDPTAASQPEKSTPSTMDETPADSVPGDAPDNAAGSVASAGGSDSAAEAEFYMSKACISCHLSGAANAPKTHDLAAWEPRMAKGMDTMVASVKDGLNAMPPKGLCFDCSDEDYQRLIKFMAGPKP